MLINAHDISLGYEGESILDHLSFSVSESDYLCIVGENGSGKSTLVKTILGLIEPIKGKVEYGDGLKRSEIGYLPQKSAIQRDFPSSVMEVVLSGTLNRHKRLFGYSKEEKAKAESILTRLGMDKYIKASYQELSGGQQQRVLLSRALMATEKVLLLDEPVTGLDVKATSELYGLLRELNANGTSLIMVTHDIHPALNDAKTILHLAEGSYFFAAKEEYFTSAFGKEFLEEAGHDHD